MTDALPRVALRTLGCKVNRAESESLAAELLGAGVELVAPDDADVIVINTCTVTGEADSKCRKEVRRALGARLEPTVVVTGCLAAVDPDALRSLGDRVIVAPDKSSLAEAVLAAPAGTGGRRCSNSPRRGPAAARSLAATDAASPGCGTRIGPPGPAATATFRTRVAIKVQDGCDHRCTYCIVPDARGNPVSVPADKLVARIAELTSAGTAEVVLTGVNLGRYRDGRADLAALVERIAATGIARIRLSSIEPLDLDERLLAALSAAPAVMPHLHVPLQSGCDRTLAAMGRGYDTAAYAGAIERARQALPGLAVTTDVIAGFPGETDADFEESFRFVRDAGFAKLHVFRYSKRNGTPAAGMPDHVPPLAKAERAARLRESSARLAQAHVSARVGGLASVLVETAAGDAAAGTSEDYLRVCLRGRQVFAPGSVVTVTLSSARDGSVWGTLVE